jgi:hypothetical protein
MRTFVPRSDVVPARRASPAPRRPRGWFRDPALWAWIVVLVLALLPLRHLLA